jgi:dTDP-4-dehydrorhamnose 3,5-epimerase-like enzyme
MSHIIKLRTNSDSRGSLTVIEKVLDFEIKRVYYIYNVDESIRGGHRHKITTQAAVCIKGSCEIFVNNGKEELTYTLNSPDQCLILEPNDWHTMSNFTSDAVLLVLASEFYDPNDYIIENYETN